MSGDRPVIVIAGDPGGKIGRLVDTAARLGTIGLGPWAVVGGLAVTCRLLVAHRVTDDVDTVTDSAEPSALQVISHTIGVQDPSDSHRVTVGGVKVDVIDTDTITADQLEGVSSEDRLFLLPHRWALETASPVTIRVHGSTVEANVALATPRHWSQPRHTPSCPGERREPTSMGRTPTTSTGSWTVTTVKVS